MILGEETENDCIKKYVILEDKYIEKHECIWLYLRERIWKKNILEKRNKHNLDFSDEC